MDVVSEIDFEKVLLNVIAGCMFAIVLYLYDFKKRERKRAQEKEAAFADSLSSITGVKTANQERVSEEVTSLRAQRTKRFAEIFGMAHRIYCIVFVVYIWLAYTFGLMQSVLELFACVLPFIIALYNKVAKARDFERLKRMDAWADLKREQK